MKLIIILILCSSALAGGEDSKQNGLEPAIPRAIINISDLLVYRSPGTLEVDPQLGGGTLAMLSSDDLAFRRIAEDYIRDPAPFYISDPRVSGGRFRIVQVRAAGKTLATMIKNIRPPREIDSLFGAIAAQLRAAEIKAAESAVRDRLVQELEHAIGARVGAPMGRPIAVVNGAADALLDELMKHVEFGPQNGLGRRGTCISVIATLEGESSGEYIYQFYRSHESFSADDATYLLWQSMRGGCTKGFSAYKEDLTKVCDQAKVGDRKYFEKELARSITDLLDKKEIAKLCKLSRVHQIDENSAVAAWDWLGDHLDRLTYDRERHVYSLDEIN